MPEVVLAVGAGGKEIASLNGTTWFDPDTDLVSGIRVFYIKAAFHAAIIDTGEWDTAHWLGTRFWGAASFWDDDARALSMAYSPSLEVMIVTGTNGRIYRRVFLSGDLPSSGSAATSPFTTSEWVNGSAWSPSLAMFVAVGGVPGGSGQARLATSTNGLSWTVRTSSFAATDFINSVAWAVSLGMFVAVGGNTSSAYKIATSTNGTSWTQRTNPFTKVPTHVVWCPGLNSGNGMFIVTGNNELATSTDGISWTLRTTGVGSNTFSQVVWSSSLHKVFAVHTGGIISSSDGINWSSVHSGSGFTGIAAGNVVNVAPSIPTDVTVNGFGNGTITHLGNATVAGKFNDANFYDNVPSAMAVRRKIGAGAYEYWDEMSDDWVSTLTWNTSISADAVTKIASINTFAWLHNNTTYDVGVAFKDTAGLESPFSANISITGNAKPVVAITSITGVGGASPTVNWSYSDAESDVQVQYRARIFTSEVSDPDTSSPLWTSGTVSSDAVFASASGIQPGTYWFFVQAFDGYTWSNWDSEEFTVTYVPPSAPTLSVVADTPNRRNTLTYTPTHDVEDFENTEYVIERLSELGEWETLISGTNSDPLEPIVYYDRTMRYRKPVSYRARTYWLVD